MDITLFKDNVNEVYNNLHKMLDGSLRKLIEENKGQPIETNGGLVDGEEIYQIAMCDGKVYFSGDEYEYEIKELTADEIFEVIMGIRE